MAGQPRSYKRVREDSKLLPIVPRIYIQPWMQDMENRELIMKNAEAGNIPHYPHDNTLYLDKREQLHYNVENKHRIEGKCPQHIDRESSINTHVSDRLSRFRSCRMYYH